MCRYSASELLDPAAINEGHSGSKETQTISQSSVPVGIVTTLPEITIEFIQHSKELVMFSTGMSLTVTFLCRI